MIQKPIDSSRWELSIGVRIIEIRYIFIDFRAQGQIIKKLKEICEKNVILWVNWTPDWRELSINTGPLGDHISSNIEPHYTRHGTLTANSMQYRLTHQIQRFEHLIVGI